MSFAHDRYFIAVERRFEKRDRIVCQKLRRNRARNAIDIASLGLTEGHVLNGLDNSENVRTALRLHRNDVLSTPAIETDIEFIDLDLAVVGNLRTQMVL